MEVREQLVNIGNSAQVLALFARGIDKRLNAEVLLLKRVENSPFVVRSYVCVGDDNYLFRL